MKFGIFYEHQVLRDALEQVELSDRLGLDCVWEVEHHFLEEYSHFSAPEVFLAAASQRTKRIRLGHGIVQLPIEFNHSARVVERIATLDVVSDGRVEFGTGEASSKAELDGFGVDRDTKRDQWTQHIDAAARRMEQGLASLRGAVGMPEQLHALLRGYADAGVDQVIFVSEAGRNRHEHICESLELFAREVMPEFKEKEDERERAKLERLGPAMERTLARRAPPREAPADYFIPAAMKA